MMRLLPILLIAGCISASATEECLDAIGLSNGSTLRGTLTTTEGGEFILEVDGARIQVPMDQVVSIETCPVDQTTPVPEPVAAPTPAPAPSTLPSTHPIPPRPVLTTPAEIKKRAHIGAELNLVGVALRLTGDVDHGIIDRAGLRVGIGGAATFDASSVYFQGEWNSFAHFMVTFGANRPVRLEVHSGPSLMSRRVWQRNYSYNYYYPYYYNDYGGWVTRNQVGWTAGAAVLMGGRHVNLRMGMTGGVIINSPYYLLFQPELGVVFTW